MSADSAARVDDLLRAYALDRYRALRRLAHSKPNRRHLIVCEDASVANYGTEEQPCDTCGDRLEFWAVIVCPHAEEDAYRWTRFGTLAGFIQALEAEE